MTGQLAPAGQLRAPDATWLLEATSADLLRLYSSIIVELRRRQVVRSSNNPVADYAECLVAKAFDLTLADKSAIGYDARSEQGIRYQVKARRLTPQNRSRQLGFIRGLETTEDPFDFLVGVLFTPEFEVLKAALVPIAVVRPRAVWVEYVKARRLILADSIWTVDGVQDVTDKLRQVAKEMDDPDSSSRRTEQPWSRSSLLPGQLP